MSLHQDGSALDVDARRDATASDVIHLRAAGVSLLLGARDSALPSVLHWGHDLGDLTRDELAALALAGVPSAVPNDLDEAVPFGALLPEHSSGWNGRPGLSGSRSGRAWSSRFVLAGFRHETDSTGGGRVVATGTDDVAGLAVTVEIELRPSGLVRQRASVTSVSPTSETTPSGSADYAVEGLALTLPVPPIATELFDLAGRWGRERSPQHAPFVVGVHSRENRRGRTGPDAPLILAAGTAGFGTRQGEVWAIHVAWSGNHVTYAERLSNGFAVLGGGELLLPGEIVLAAGETYAGPWIYGAHSGAGLDGIAARFHSHLRARPQHPRHPRPVVMNTWEAVYFDHDLERLGELARLGAAVGVERYVLDDGWFRHRRHDRAGLGDWYVDEGVWPGGLHPLVDVVRGLGMEFGLWVEPEMVNLDSDLARAHPDWVLGTGGRTPLSSRFQQVLDLAHPGAYAYVLGRLDALLTEYPIAYLKWDHNRDLLEAGGRGGVPGVHAQTVAVYRLLDELRARHPGVEIESCSSGGLRVDLEVLEHTDRVWGSDVIDPLERQQIQRWTAQLLPPELVGSHVGAPRAHTTGRTHDLAFRAGTALFGSFGIEWDLTAASDLELKELAVWVALYKEVRELVHTGEVVRAPQHDPSFAVHGVVAPDRFDALFALVQLITPATSVPGPVRLPGLDPARRYHVRLQPPGGLPAHVRGLVPPPWLADGVTLPGAVLEHTGLRAPALHPEQLMLIRVSADTGDDQERSRG